MKGYHLFTILLSSVHLFFYHLAVVIVWQHRYDLCRLGARVCDRVWQRRLTSLSNVTTIKWLYSTFFPTYDGYTSWMCELFSYYLLKKINLNLSINLSSYWKHASRLSFVYWQLLPVFRKHLFRIFSKHYKVIVDI